MGYKMAQDWHKVEAKTSLWNMDGMHVQKRWRNHGKARGKDKALIRAELDAILTPEEQAQLAQDEMLNAEADEAWYCYKYGPCDRCKGHPVECPEHFPNWCNCLNEESHD